MYSHLTRRVPCEHIRARARPWEPGFLKMRWFNPGNVLDVITVAMVGRLGWYDSQYPVALSACLSGKGVRSGDTVCRSRRELSNAYLLAKIGVDTAENEPLEVWGENSIQYSIVSLVLGRR